MSVGLEIGVKLWKGLYLIVSPFWECVLGLDCIAVSPAVDTPCAFGWFGHLQLGVYVLATPGFPADSFFFFLRTYHEPGGFGYLLWFDGVRSGLPISESPSRQDGI